MNDRNQIVITGLRGKIVMVYMEHEKILDVLVGEEEPEEVVEVGDIFVGKVQNIVENIKAAFIEIQKGVVGFLPLSECRDRTIRCGDEFVVQVKKAAVKTKQPVLTLYPEIAGRTAVVSTGSAVKGVSKKITAKEQQKRLRELLAGFEEEPYGLVIRTCAETAPEEEIVSECRTLLQEMHELMDYSSYKTCFSRLRKEVPFYLNYIHSFPTGKLDRIITDLPPVYEELQPPYGSLVIQYEDESYSLDKLLGISSKLEKAYEKRVWLKSGGNLVIEPTEALTVIDVNTGKAVDGKRNKETTFYRINREAAEEAARQIRMRNLSGIILIDFIDMKKKEHNRQLLEFLRMKLAEDRTKTVLVDMTRLGLVEITRMKKNPPLREVLPWNTQSRDGER